jgi:hypothetical protein
MAARNNVRTHTRKTASGGTTTVREHSRTGRPRRRGMVTPAHAWNLAKRAVKAGRRKKKVTAAVLGALALGELAAWLALEGAGLMLATAAVLALGVAWVAAAAGGIDLQ